VDGSRGNEAISIAIVDLPWTDGNGAASVWIAEREGISLLRTCSKLVGERVWHGWIGPDEWRQLATGIRNDDIELLVNAGGEGGRNVRLIADEVRYYLEGVGAPIERS